MGAGIYADDRADSCVSDERAAMSDRSCAKATACPNGIIYEQVGGWADAESFWPNHEQLFLTAALAWVFCQ